MREWVVRVACRGALCQLEIDHQGWRHQAHHRFRAIQAGMAGMAGVDGRRRKKSSALLRRAANAARVGKGSMKGFVRDNFTDLYPWTADSTSASTYDYDSGSGSGPAWEWDFDMQALPQPQPQPRHINNDNYPRSVAFVPEQALLGRRPQNTPSGQHAGDLLSPTSVTLLGAEPRHAPDHAGGTTAKLLELQGQLYSHMCAQSPSAKRDRVAAGPDNIARHPHPLVDEVLAATKSLLEILQATQANGAESLHESAPAPQREEGTDYFGVLHALTCYAYVIEILEPIVSSLAIQIEGTAEVRPTPASGDLDLRLASNGTSPSAPTVEHLLDRGPALNMGCFSLASQPALNAHVVLHTVLMMVQQLQTLIRLLLFGCQNPAGDAGDEYRIRSRGDWTAKSRCTPKSVTAQSMLSVIQEKDTALLEKLRYLTNGRCL